MELPEVAPESCAELVRNGLDNFRARLPEGWELQETREDETKYDATTAAIRRPDATAVLTAPDGTSAKFVIETKKNMERRNVSQVLSELDFFTRQADTTALVISRYLSPSVREALTKGSASYVDATGNIRIQTSNPSVYIADRGLDSDPWRSRLGRKRGTLRGIPASRTVRTLVDFDRDWSVRELVEESNVSIGATYRVLEYLRDEDLVEKNDSARYRVRAWRAIIEAWSKDYGFQKSNRTMSFIDPRGISNLNKIARSTESFNWAFTGSIAASEWAPYAPARAEFIYVENITVAAEAWALRPAKTGANVILAEPESTIAFKGVVVSAETGLRIAAPSQVAVDLLTSPGRNPSEGIELLNWMERNESAWRR
jgi:hypothetical protein